MEKGLPGNPGFEARAWGVILDNPAHPFDQLRSALAIVETDVETGMRVARDDVAGRIVDLEVGHLKVRRLEPFRAFVQRHGFQRGEDAGEARSEAHTSELQSLMRIS